MNKEYSANNLKEEINTIRRLAGLPPIMEEKMVDVWHVTEKQNVPNILKNGLEPRIGKSSRSAGEKEAAIYVFPDELSMEDAVTNWLGDETEYRQTALILRIPESWVTQDHLRWEATIKQPVPPHMIKVAIPDLDESQDADQPKPFITAHRSGKMVWIDMMSVPPQQRRQGVGRAYFEQWERDLPNDIEYIRIVPVDAGSGKADPFWEAMGFDYLFTSQHPYDHDVPDDMVKGVNGQSAPGPFEYEPE